MLMLRDREIAKVSFFVFFFVCLLVSFCGFSDESNFTTLIGAFNFNFKCCCSERHCHGQDEELSYGESQHG